MPTPPRPAIFAPEHAPAGVEVKFVTFAASRPPITPRLALVHTNGAENEGSVDSAWNWSHAAPGVNTLPHYQVDRTHNGVTRCRKMLATNRRGIGNATLLSAQAGHGNVTNWSIVIETADLGWPTANRPTAPGGTVGFDPGQGELIATILAYESIVHDFPLTYPQDWWDAGAACHTEPYGYPYWTIKPGKPCPGPQKKTDMRGWVLPRAQVIAAAWSHPEPPDDEEDDVALEKIVKPSGFGQPWWPWLACYTNGVVRPAVSGETATEVKVADEGQYRRLCAAAGVQLTVEKP